MNRHHHRPPDYRWLSEFDAELRDYHHNPGLVVFDTWPGPAAYFGFLENV